MRKVVVAGVALSALTLGASPAWAQDDSPLSMSVDTTECGQATFTFTNPTDFVFAMEYWNEDQEPSDTPHPVVEDDFIYQPTLTVDGRDADEPESKSVTVDFEEDQSDGEIAVFQRVQLGAEQDFYLDEVTATLDTDCEDPAPPAEEEEPPADEDENGACGVCSGNEDENGEDGSDDDGQVDEVPVGGVDTGGGSSGPDALGFLLAGGLVLTAGGTAYAARRGSTRQDG